jgi:N-formylglutamate amidohydrolase
VVVTPFVVFEPEQDSPVLVEVPHAGLLLDAEAASWTTAPARSIARDADSYVDELFADAPALDATLLCAQISRYVVDLNRAPDDYDGAAVRGGPPRARPRGVIWRLTSEGTPVLREPVSAAEYARRRDTFHAPYHDQLSALLERKRARFGLAVLLCAHSMPSPRPQRGRVVYTADLVPGSRGRTSADERFVDLIGRVGIDVGWRVEHDVPYRGGYSTGHYGRPDEGLHAVQIEVARRLYMDENSLARSPEGFAAVRAFAKQLVSELVREARAAADP